MAAGIVTLHASGAETVTGTGSTIDLGTQPSINAVFVLDLTAAATETGDTLDVFVQTRVDGTNWIDVIHFTQAVGDGGAKRYIGKVCAGIAMTMFENGTALGAGAVRDILGAEWRCRWAIVDVATAANQSFTFSVIGTLDQ